MTRSASISDVYQILFPKSGDTAVSAFLSMQTLCQAELYRQEN